MKILLLNADLYTPEHHGLTNILIEDGIISYIGKRKVCDVDELIDCIGNKVCPMFVDGHEHLLGNYWDEESIIMSGVGTIVACLANEPTSTHVKKLIQITNKLNECGIDPFCLAGSKNFVEETTGFILENESVVGIKTALFQEQRPKPNLSYEKLKQDAILTYEAGKKTNKTTQVHIHLDHPFAKGEKMSIHEIETGKHDNLSWIDKIVEETGVPYSLFKLTHAQKYYNRILEYANKGCFIDYTAFHKKYDERYDCLVEAIKSSSVDLTKVSISSDLGIMAMERGEEKDSPISLLNTMKKLIEKGVPFESVLSMITTNALSPIKKEKCLITENKRAKILVLNEELNIDKIILNDKIITNDNIKIKIQ